MKKSAIAVFAGLMSVATFAGMNNVLVTFSTVGPDHYADGSQVEPGEVYALVWTRAGHEFQGVDARGNAVDPENNKVVIKAPVATEKGNCPLITFQVDEDYANNNYKDKETGSLGTWGVYLLDTRKFKADEDGVILKGEDGKPIVESVGLKTGVVNGYGAVATLASADKASVDASTSINAATTSVVPDGASNLKIESMDLRDGQVWLTVSGSSSCLQYGVSSGSSPDSLTPVTGGNTQYGKDGELMTIVTPMKSGTQFFKVNRK